MIRCWYCNSRVLFGDDGWLCPCCRQHGKPDLIADDWEHGRKIKAPYMEKIKAPYMEKKNADQ